MKIRYFLIVMLTMAALLAAQAGRGKGRLSGVVLDEKGSPIADAKVVLEFDRGGLRDETKTNAKGEWAFIGLGTGNANIFTSADGYLEDVTATSIQQLSANPQIKIVLREDLEKKARIKDEAALTLLDQGNTLFGDRKYTEALTLYNQFAAENPTLYQIHFNIGDCYREMRENEKAMAQYQLGLDKAKENSDLVLQSKAYASMGEVFLRLQEFEKAQKYFVQSIDLNPSDEILAYNVAEIYFSSNDVDNAIKYYQVAIRIKPEWGAPYLKMGYSYLNKGDIPKAVENFNQFLKLDPDSPEAPNIQALLSTLPKK